MIRPSVASVASVLSVLSVPSVLSSQDVRATGDTIVVAVDTTHRMSPLGATWRSLLVPGWGQAATGRPVTGAALVLWEGVTFYMWQKAERERDYLVDIGASHVSAKDRESEDWLVLLVFNHLFAAAEAYVSGHLQDFPGDLKLQLTPRRIGVSIPLP